MSKRSKQICAGYNHSLVVASNNELYVFGCNANGQLVRFASMNNI